MESLAVSKKRVTIPLIWLLLYIVVTPVSLSNDVLCIGSDSRVEFEMGTDGQCTDVLPIESQYGEVCTLKPHRKHITMIFALIPPQFPLGPSTTCHSRQRHAISPRGFRCRSNGISTAFPYYSNLHAASLRPGVNQFNTSIPSYYNPPHLNLVHKIYPPVSSLLA